MGARFGAGVRSLVSRGGGELAVGAEAKGAGSGPRSECLNSFAAGTRVVIANGTVKAIEKIRLGDVVLASDP